MEYGGSEVVSRMFTCELCNKEVKHTRNIIGAHMKMVHLISWKEYQVTVQVVKRWTHVIFTGHHSEAEVGGGNCGSAQP